MKLYFDECVSPAIADSLRPLLVPDGIELASARDADWEGVEDVEWIERLRAEGPCAVVSHDVSMRRRPFELEAMYDSGLACYLSAKAVSQLKLRQQALVFLRQTDQILEHASTHPGGGVFMLPASGKIWRCPRRRPGKTKRVRAKPSRG